MPFQILRKLGQGGYGTLYEGIDVETQTPVALKKMSLVSEAGISFVCLREATTLKTLAHPNVVKLHRLELTSDHMFLVLEFCDGGDLNDYLQSLVSPMDEGRMRSYARQMLLALEYMHNLRIAHRDLKPDNMVLCGADKATLKVCDFGLSRALVASGVYTPRCATPFYRSPEIMMGAKRYDPMALDMWSIGCILMELITLRRTFPGANEFEVPLHVFRALGTPTEDTWPGVSKLPDYLPVFPKWRQRAMPVRTPVDIVEIARGTLRLRPEERMDAAAAVRCLV